MQLYLRSFRGDLLGGVTAAVVVLPVALALGEVSGLGVLSGLYGAIAVGFFAAVFGGTRTQISAPTGPMAVAMAVVVTLHADNLPAAFTIVIMAGFFQVLLGFAGIGRFVAFTPYSVTSGFMSGIGIIIILLQTLPFIGMPVAEGGVIGSIKGWGEGVTNINFSAVAIASVTLAVAVLWPVRFRRVLPPTLVALGVGTMMGVLWLSGAPVIGDVPTGLPTLQLPDLSVNILLRAIQPALTIALLGSIDSLLTSLIADSITRTQHDPNRELVGQGIGNMAAGFLGGVPGAGATLGTIVNIRAGGRTRVSSVIPPIVLVGLVMGLAKYVEVIPFACLAGILMKVGWDIIDWRFLTRILRVQREHLLVMGITLGLTVFVDLVTAVAIGLITTGMATSRQFERLQLESVLSVPMLDKVFLRAAERPDIDEHSAHVGIVTLRGAFTVASSHKLIIAISKDISEHDVVIFDFTPTVYMDDSAALVIEQLIDDALAEDTACIVMGLHGQPARTLSALNALSRIPEEQVVPDRQAAREVALALLGMEAADETGLVEAADPTAPAESFRRGVLSGFGSATLVALAGAVLLLWRRPFARPTAAHEATTQIYRGANGAMPEAWHNALAAEKSQLDARFAAGGVDPETYWQQLAGLAAQAGIPERAVETDDSDA